jgi:hypothetical protein
MIIKRNQKNMKELMNEKATALEILSKYSPVLSALTY